MAASEKKGPDRPPEKERKKDVPAPRMQFDDKSRVDKAKKRALVNQTEVRNRVELFRHLPQYEHGTQLPDLGSMFFQLDPMHPAVYKVLIWEIILTLFFSLKFLCWRALLPMHSSKFVKRGKKNRMEVKEMEAIDIVEMLVLSLYRMSNRNDFLTYHHVPC